MPNGRAPTTKTLGVKISRKTHDKIAAAAKTEGRTISNWVNRHFDCYFSTSNKENR